MKKLNKKWLIGISSLSIGIGVVSPPIIASKINYNSKNINEYKDNLNTKIDYNLVESLLFKKNNNSKNINNKSYIYKNLNSQIINSKYIKKWDNLSNLNKDLESFEKIPYNLTNKQQKEINKNKIEYFNKFKNKNYSLEQVDSFLSNNFSEYKNISSNFKDMLIKDANDYSNTKNSKNVVKNLKSKSNKVVSINELEKQIKYLTDAKVAFATMAAVAAVSSAISWAFLLVPSAIALSVASIACGVVVSALDIALVSLGEQRNAALLTGSLTLDIVKIGFAKASICYKLPVSSIATVTSVSWVLPALVALISLGSLIITIIYAYVL